MIDISIVIPVYNVEKYIDRCLDSIFGQNFNGNFEVITINDASTDNSLERLLAYKRKKENLIIINNETNLKLTKSRLAGMLIAKGRYIMHLDSDDWIVKNTFQILKNCIDRYNPDVIVYNYILEDENSFITKVDGVKNECLTTDKLKVVDLFLGATVTKLVKREFTQDLISSGISINHSEDLLYCLELLMKVNNIFLLPKELYVYFQNPASITHNARNKSFLKDQLVVLDVLDKLNDKFNFNSIGIHKLIKKYYCKYIYLSFCQIHFLEEHEVPFMNSFYKQISSKNNTTFFNKKDVYRLRLSIYYKYWE